MIVITTPTGDIGHQVLENVIAGSESIRVIVRDASKLAPEMRERVEVVRGSHGEDEEVNRAFAGADSVFWVVPPAYGASSMEAAYLDFTKPAYEAIKTHGVTRVVSVSALGRGTELGKHAGLVTVSLAMDELLASTGVHFRALTMPSFMDNVRRQVEPIKNQGMFFSPINGDMKAPTCATKDIAAVASRLLLDSTWTGQEDVPLLGPEDLSLNEMAAIISEVLGKTVRYQQVPIEGFKENLRKGGMSEAFIAGYADMMEAKNAGLDNAVVRTAENSTPTSFQKWCEEVLKPAVF